MLADQGTDGGDNPRALGAEFFHGGKGGVDDAAQGALPAGMSGTDHTAIAVGKQHRRAVGRQHAR